MAIRKAKFREHQHLKRNSQVPLCMCQIRKAVILNILNLTFMLHLCLVMKSKRNSDFQIGSSSINCRATKLKKLIQLLYFTLLNMFLSTVYLYETSRVTNFFFHTCLKVESLVSKPVVLWAAYEMRAPNATTWPKIQKKQG